MTTATPTQTATLPRPRGPVSAALFAALRGDPGGFEPITDPRLIDDPISGEDVPLALYALYELHYQGFADVDDGWEWDIGALRLRARLEQAFLQRLRDAVAIDFGTEPIDVAGVAPELRSLAASGGPSLSAFLASDGTLEQLRECTIHRSLYSLKEADPHTWAIPRFRGAAKAALVTIQADEYGSGCAPEMHSALFADAMDALGLDSRYGAYLDLVPGEVLSTVNLMSLFGLHRRWRGAIVGHLALFEMCSVIPMGRYIEALDRHGVATAAPFYAAHVIADEWHQTIALDDMVAGVLREEPELAADVVFGARALDHLERRFARRLLRAWSRNESSLYDRFMGAGGTNGVNRA